MMWLLGAVCGLMTDQFADGGDAQQVAIAIPDRFAVVWVRLERNGRHPRNIAVGAGC